MDHGVFGYSLPSDGLREAVVSWLARRFDWHVDPAALLFIPGLVSGFNVACRAACHPGQGVLVQTPVYPPMLAAPANHGLMRDETMLVLETDGRYGVDWEAMEAAITARTRLFLLCSPHNPTGRVFAAEELARMAELCLRHDLLICSDEIHCDLVYAGQRHIPTAMLGPEIAARTITLMAPSKTFNIPGLGFSLAIIEDPTLRTRYEAAAQGIVPHVGALGYVAALAAYSEGELWLEACLHYLEENRNYLAAYVAAHMPGIRLVLPEATYLAWLDCREAGLREKAAQFFLDCAGVALNEGATFGRGGEGFVRLNFGCSRAMLTRALNCMASALRISARPA